MQDDTSPIETAINIVKQKDYPSASRLNAILYLVEKFEPICFSVLADVLEDAGEEIEVRSGAALALGRAGEPRALEILTRMAKQDDATLKNYAVQALGLLGCQESIPLLLEALKDTDNAVFASAAEALGKIGKPVVPHLIELIQPGNPEDARCIAAWQLGGLRYAEALPVLIHTIRNDHNPEVIALAVWALGEIGVGPADVLETLTWARQQPDPAISERAEMALKKITRHVN